MKKIGKLLAIGLCLCTLLTTGCASVPTQGSAPKRADLEYVFVHGLSGWGSYDSTYKFMPYWGMFGGDLMKYLGEQGYSCYAASVAPEGSAWDRACELYAQLTGTVTDYGKAHSAACHHEQFGPDFTGRALIPNWENGKKIVLLGHSFGGATVRLFSEILANGDETEKAATKADELSGFFAGGQGDRIHALVTLAAPTNGTTAYDLYQDENFDPESVEVSWWSNVMGDFFNKRPQADKDGRDENDYAGYDMHIDNAQALNARISTLPNTYYFAVPCSATEAKDGGQRPIDSMMESMFRRGSARMGAYTGVTKGGFCIDESWQENDGLVNTISAMAPFGAPFTEYRQGAVEPGVWQIMPTYKGDHMSLQGGMTVRNDVKPFYDELLGIIDALPIE